MRHENGLTCPACGATATRPLYWKPADEEWARPGRQPAGVAGHQIVACEGCGLGRVDPLPGPDELARLYDADYFNPPAFRGRVSDALLSYRPLSGPPRLQAIRVASEQAYEQARLDVIEAAARRLREERLPSRPLRFLDIGSGRGGALQAAQRRGWTALGVEPSPSAARLAAGRGLPIWQGSLAEGALPDGAFDIVHLREVLEHVRDPLALLRAAARTLRPDGLLYIQVPNDLQGYRRQVFGRIWWLIPPHHLWYFTFDSLARLLDQVGLTIVVRGTLGFGAGYDTYRYLGARLRVLGWLDRHEDGRLALAPRLVRAAFRAAGAPIDALINRAQRHSSLWVGAMPAHPKGLLS